MPDWLTRHLETTGALDGQGRGRRAHQRWCGGCGIVVLQGYDADLCARLVTVDPTPLSALGEALALVAGRYTCTVRLAAGRAELDSRTAGQIRYRPAAAPGTHFDVLAEHRCGWQPLPAAETYRPEATHPTHRAGCTCPPPF